MGIVILKILGLVFNPFTRTLQLMRICSPDLHRKAS